MSISRQNFIWEQKRHYDFLTFGYIGLVALYISFILKFCFGTLKALVVIQEVLEQFVDSFEEFVNSVETFSVKELLSHKKAKKDKKIHSMACCDT